MDCREINRMLNEHVRLDSGALQASGVSTHLESCFQCADSWLAHKALLQDKVGSCPPELRSAVREALRATPLAEARPKPMWRMASVIGMVAASALGIMLLRPSDAPHEPAANGSIPAAPPGTVFADAMDPGNRNHRFVDGVHYRSLLEPVPTAAADRIEVCEFFMFPCIHCFDLEMPLQTWYEQQSSVVSLRRVPVIWNESTRLQARAYFAAQELGVQSAMAQFFDEIHVQGRNPNSVGAIREMFGRWGIEGARFDAAFDSDAVDHQMAEAVALNRRYAITSTPVLAVNGRFVTDAGMAGGSYDDLFAVVDYLIGAEREAEVLFRAR